MQSSPALMQVPVSAANMWVTIFIVITQVGVAVTIMQVVFSPVHTTVSFVIMQVTVSVVAM